MAFRKRLLLALAALVFLAVGGLFMQFSRPDGPVVSMPYWEARKDLATVWLVGEVHNDPFRSTTLPTDLVTRIRDSDAVGFELAATEAVRYKFHDYQARPIQGRITPGLWQKVLAKIRSAPLPNGTFLDVRAFELLNPVWAAAGIEVIAREQYLTSKERKLIQRPQGSMSLTQHIARQASAMSKTTISLDTLPALDRLWDHCDRAGRTEELIELSLSAWSNPSYRATLLEEVPSLVAEGKADELVAALRRHPLGALTLDCVVVPRNRLWAVRIGEQSRSYPKLLYVFGAGHLGGDEGILNLLRRDGYQVQRKSMQP